MIRQHSLVSQRFPNPVFNLEFNNMTSITSLKESISGRTLTSSATSSYLEIGTTNSHKYLKVKTRAAKTKFTDTYNQNNYPELYTLFNTATAPFSILCLINVEPITDTSTRWGFLSVYNLTRICGYGTGKTSHPAMFGGVNSFQNGYIPTYFTPVIAAPGGKTLCFFFVASDTTGYYCYNSSGAYTYVQGTYGSRQNAVAGTGTVTFLRSQENSYHCIAGPEFYGLTIYDGVLTEANLIALINGWTTYSPDLL